MCKSTLYRTNDYSRPRHYDLRAHRTLTVCDRGTDGVQVRANTLQYGLPGRTWSWLLESPPPSDRHTVGLASAHKSMKASRHPSNRRKCQSAIRQINASVAPSIKSTKASSVKSTKASRHPSNRRRHHPQNRRKHHLSNQRKHHPSNRQSVKWTKATLHRIDHPSNQQ